MTGDGARNANRMNRQAKNRAIRYMAAPLEWSVKANRGALSSIMYASKFSGPGTES
jgi:hypothetical protein